MTVMVNTQSELVLPAVSWYVYITVVAPILKTAGGVGGDDTSCMLDSSVTVGGTQVASAVVPSPNSILIT